MNAECYESNMNELEPHQNTTQDPNLTLCLSRPLVFFVYRLSPFAEAIIIEYSPMEIHKLDGASLQMRIPSGTISKPGWSLMTKFVVLGSGNSSLKFVVRWLSLMIHWFLSNDGHFLMIEFDDPLVFGTFFWAPTGEGFSL